MKPQRPSLIIYCWLIVHWRRIPPFVKEQQSSTQTSQASCSFKEIGLQGGMAEVMCRASCTHLHVFSWGLSGFLYPRSALFSSITPTHLCAPSEEAAGCVAAPLRRASLGSRTATGGGQGARWPVRPCYGEGTFGVILWHKTTITRGKGKPAIFFHPGLTEGHIKEVLKLLFSVCVLYTCTPPC